MGITAGLEAVLVKSIRFLYTGRMGKKRIPREVVLAMRKQHQAGYTIEAIRIAYGYTRKTVSDLVNHKTHKRVRLAPNDSGMCRLSPLQMLARQESVPAITPRP